MHDNYYNFLGDFPYSLVILFNKELKYVENHRVENTSKYYYGEKLITFPKKLWGNILIVDEVDVTGNLFNLRSCGN